MLDGSLGIFGSERNEVSYQTESLNYYNKQLLTVKANCSRGERSSLFLTIETMFSYCRRLRPARFASPVSVRLSFKKTQAFLCEDENDFKS